MALPEKQPTEISTRVFAATSEMVLEMIKRRLGVGVAPKYLLGSLDNLHVIEPTTKRLLDYLWINQRKSKMESGLEEVFLKSLEKGLKKFD